MVSPFYIKGLVEATLKVVVKRWWKRLWCFHATWHPTLDDRYFRLGLKGYRCDWCGKERHFPKEKPPISLIEAWPPR